MYKVFENVEGVVGQIAEEEGTPEGLDYAIFHAKWYEEDNLVPTFVMDTNDPDDPVRYGNPFHTSIADV